MTPRTTGRTRTTTEASVRVALALGSNMGEPISNLRGGIGALRTLLSDLRIGPLFLSAAEGPAGQPDFYNTAVIGGTRLGPADLLANLKRIEWESGRRPGERNAPRPLDIDLLLYGDAISSRPELTLPHPRMLLRRFVLEPLAAIAPDLPVPPDGETVGEHLRRLPESEQIQLLDWPEADPAGPR